MVAVPIGRDVGDTCFLVRGTRSFPCLSVSPLNRAPVAGRIPHFFARNKQTGSALVRH
jgi:hypothetical protein